MGSVDPSDRSSRRILAAFIFGFTVLSALRPDVPGNDPDRAYTSHAALNLAHEVENEVATLDFDDPRLAPTTGFVVPHATLATTALEPSGRSAASGYAVHWQIRDDVPAPAMKEIRIRVTWPARGGRGELSTTVVKAS